MKKIIAVLLLSSLLLLCACGKADPSAAVTTAAPAETAATEATTKDPTMPSGKAADAAQLPEAFPPLPEGVVNLTVSHLSGTGKLFGYALERTRISFECYEPVFYQFTNSLIDAGYTGACRNITTGELYSLGFTGSWQDGKHIIVIDKSEKTSANLIRITLDYENYSDCFPHSIGPEFPAFSAASRSKGSYIGYDYASGRKTEVFQSISAFPCWQWQFRFDDAFIGITEEAFRAYMEQLEAAGFSGNVSQTTHDGCQVYEADVVKSMDSGDFGVFMMYNTSLLTLDIVFTNDPGYFLGENWKNGN